MLPLEKKEFRTQRLLSATNEVLIYHSYTQTRTEGFTPFSNEVLMNIT